ncbi:MAG: PepSY domain-containing protein [Hyphomicrobiaceae bacterium]|nr:PepSY domain-containing protein [Hyphomicrobiaceae bacterium]
MLRKFHTYPALISAVLIVFMAITGVVLSFEPLVAHFSTPASSGAAPANVADLAAGVADNIANVQRLVRKPGGEIIAYAFGPQGPEASYVDPATGAATAPYAPSAFFQFFTELHRSLFFGDAGRILTGLAAFAMAVLAVGGIFLTARRMGGFRQFFAKAKGTLAQRLHVETGRLSVIVLSVLAVTGVYMSLTFFGLVGGPADGGSSFFFPESAGDAPAAISELAALKDIRLTDLRELDFPAQGDVHDVFTVITGSGTGYVDQTNGDMLSFTPNSFGENLYQTFYILHTGQSSWIYALLLGAGGLAALGLVAAGLVIWWKRGVLPVRIKGNDAARKADHVILVGSESRGTWGFAKTLHDALKDEGHKVHVAPMNALARHYDRATSLFVLTSTYGDGDAPASAKTFLSKLAKAAPVNHSGKPLDYLVLGFGDRSFAHFCAYAETVDQALEEAGLRRVLPFVTVDKQSSQQFAEWGRALSPVAGTPLTLHHVAETNKTRTFVLESRRDYGLEFQRPKSILRFRPLAEEKTALQKFFARFRPDAWQAGDLVGITPPDGAFARYYSLASSATDGFVEICVSKLPGGQCSTYLTELKPGDTIEAFFRENTGFRAPSDDKPLILVGAGSGIAPLLGFIRANANHREVHLFWGGADPKYDFLYRDELMHYRQDGRLTGAQIAFSRGEKREYVQDRLRADARFVSGLIDKGARVMVCGGGDMARGVRDAFTEIVAPLGKSIDQLRADARYAEDVF